MEYLVHFVGYATIALALGLPVLWHYSKKRHIQRLRKSLRVIFGFATVGFLMAWALLAVYAVTRANLNSGLLVALCPTSIMSMGLDNASFALGMLCWLIISLTNAALYSIIGIVVGAALFPLWKTNAPEPASKQSS